MVAGGRSSDQMTIGGFRRLFSSSGGLEARGLGRGGRGGDGGPNWGGEAAGGWPDGGSWRLGASGGEKTRGEGENGREGEEKKREMGLGLSKLVQFIYQPTPK